MSKTPLLNNNIFTTNFSEIELIPLADLHIGAESTDMQLIRDIFDYAKKKKNCYIILVGDLIDMITYQSKGLIHTQKLFATEQIKTLMSLLRPIKEKIIFAVTGNHEDRTVKNSGLDLTALIADELGFTYKKAECHFIIRFKDKDHSDMFYCYANHNSGGGGGSTKSGKHNKLTKLHDRYPAADLIIGAHTHGQSTDKGVILYLDRTGNLKKKNQYFVCAGTALGNEDYAAKIGCSPTATGLRIIRIRCAHDNPKNRFKVTVIDVE